MPTKHTRTFTVNVLVMKTENFWIAQGVELDYEAQGRTWIEVRYAFEQGLVATAQAHIRRFGHLRNFLKPASERIQEEYRRFKKASFRKKLLRKRPPMRAQASLPLFDRKPPANIRFVLAA